MKRVLIIALAGTLAAMAQTPLDSLLQKLRTSELESHEAAVAGLDVFRTLVTEQNYRNFGFQSAVEVATATIGDPLVAIFVPLDRLRQYQPGGDPVALFAGGDKVVYPVLVNQQVRSSITVDKVNGVWRASAFGGSNFVRMLSTLREDTQGGAAFVVEAAAIGYYALARATGGTVSQVVVASVTDYLEAQIRAGVVMPAQQAFAQLVPVARAYNGLPR